MEITQQQFETNFETLQDEEKGMVAGLIENNEPPALQAFAKTLGVQFPTSIDEPMRPEDSIDYIPPEVSVLEKINAERYGSDEVDQPMENKRYDPDTGEEMTTPNNSPEDGRDTLLQEAQREDMVNGGVTGPIQKEGADNSGVADDVPMDAEQESFVINAAAVDEVGELDLEQRIIQPAVEALQKEGIKITIADLKRPQEQVNGDVPVAVSNGEYYIPRVLARKIGYGLLKKINDRGKPETEKKLEEQKEQQPQDPQAEMQAALGKRIQMNKGDPVDIFTELKKKLKSREGNVPTAKKLKIAVDGKEEDLPTIGYGHQVTNKSAELFRKLFKMPPPTAREVAQGKKRLTKKQADILFDYDFTQKKNDASRRISKELLKSFDDLPQSIQEVMIDANFRGDLTKNNKLQKWVGLAVSGDYAASAKEYLNHQEYKKRKKANPKDGVVKRMEENSKQILSTKDTTSISGMQTTTLDEVLPGRDEPIIGPPEEDPSYVPPSFGATASGEVVGP